MRTVLLAAAVAVLVVGAAEAANIKVLSTQATEEAYRELVPEFEQATGHKVETTFTGTVEVQRRIAAGERYDAVIIVDTAIDDFINGGKVVPGSRVDIARSSIGAGVRAGAPKPDISSADRLKNALLAAKSIGYSTGPSGTYLVGLFEKLGIAAAVSPKLKQTPSGVFVGSIIASGEAEIGFQQINELSHFPGVDYLGPLPAQLQDTTWRSGGILVGAGEPEAARALLRFLAAPAAAAITRKHGLEPQAPP
jgi:molybdate transport system substrate-binding protein